MISVLSNTARPTRR